MWFLTFDGYLVNLVLAARIYPRKTEDGRAEVAAVVPGWREVAYGRDFDLRAGYVPVKLVTCADLQEAKSIVECFNRSLRAGVRATDWAEIPDFPDLKSEEGSGDA